MTLSVKMRSLTLAISKSLLSRTFGVSLALAVALLFTPIPSFAWQPVMAVGFGNTDVHYDDEQYQGDLNDPNLMAHWTLGVRQRQWELLLGQRNHDGFIFSDADMSETALTLGRVFTRGRFSFQPQIGISRWKLKNVSGLRWGLETETPRLDEDGMDPVIAINGEVALGQLFSLGLGLRYLDTSLGAVTTNEVSMFLRF